MSSSAISSFGVNLKLGDGATPETFTTIAEVGDVGGGAMTTDNEEVTNHDSPNGHKEYIPTLTDTGAISFPINLIHANATHIELKTLARSKEVRNWQIVDPDADATTFYGPAFVSSYEVTRNVAGVLQANIELQPTGEWTQE